MQQEGGQKETTLGKHLHTTYLYYSFLYIGAYDHYSIFLLFTVPTKPNPTCPSVRPSVRFSVSVLLLLSGRVQLDHVVDSQDGDGSLCCESQALNLRNRRLHHSCGQVIPHHSVREIQAAVTQAIFLLVDNYRSHHTAHTCIHT